MSVSTPVSVRGLVLIASDKCPMLAYLDEVDSLSLSYEQLLTRLRIMRRIHVAPIRHNISRAHQLSLYHSQPHTFGELPPCHVRMCMLQYLLNVCHVGMGKDKSNLLKSMRRLVALPLAHLLVNTAFLFRVKLYAYPLKIKGWVSSCHN